MADYIYSMETRLTPDQQSGVNLVQEIARRPRVDVHQVRHTAPSMALARYCSIQ